MRRFQGIWAVPGSFWGVFGVFRVSQAVFGLVLGCFKVFHAGFGVSQAVLGLFNAVFGVSQAIFGVVFGVFGLQAVPEGPGALRGDSGARESPGAFLPEIPPVQPRAVSFCW